MAASERNDCLIIGDSKTKLLNQFMRRVEKAYVIQDSWWYMSENQFKKLKNGLDCII